MSMKFPFAEETVIMDNCTNRFDILFAFQARCPPSAVVVKYIVDDE